MSGEAKPSPPRPLFSIGPNGGAWTSDGGGWDCTPTAYASDATPLPEHSVEVDLRALCATVAAKVQDPDPNSRLWACNLRWFLPEYQALQPPGLSEAALLARDVAEQLREVEVATLGQLRALVVPDPDTAAPDVQTAIVLAKM